MEIKYDAKTDMMYIRFSDTPFHANHVVNDAVVVDLAENGDVIGIELISPSLYVDNLEEMIYRFHAKDTPAPAKP
jgi:uncharacterized protein YuzE